MITQASIAEGTDMVIAQTAVNWLELCFPGYQWTANYDKGVLSLKNLSLSDNWGMVLKGRQLSKRLIITKGGEFLDRFGMPPRFNADIVESAPRDFTGAIVSEKWTKDRRYWNKTEKRWKAAV